MSQHNREDTLWQRWRVFPRLLQLLWELGRRDVLMIAGFSLINGLAPLLSLLVLQRFVDSTADAISGNISLSVALVWLALLFVVEGLKAIFGFWEILIEDIQKRLTARAQERLLQKAGRLSLAAFESPMLFDQLHRAQQGLDKRLLNVLTYLLPIPSYLITTISLLVYVGSAHIFFPIILLLGLVPTYGLFTRYFQQTYLLARKHTPFERMLTYLGDLMADRRAAAEIRLFSLQDYFLTRYQQIFRQLRDDRIKMARDRQRTDVPRAFGKALTAGAVAVGLTVLIAQGRLSIGAFVAYLSATNQLGSSIGMVILGIAMIDGDLRYMQDVFDYLDLDEEMPDRRTVSSVSTASSSREKPSPMPTIRFEQVTFAYPHTAESVLRDISFTLHPGERMALVGANGAGKSTLAKLLLGLYQPTSGRITVDGVDLATLPPHWWYTQATAVFQNYAKYELTAQENIGFGNLPFLQDRWAIQTAAARSGADAVVATLPSGYDTFLGKAYDEQGEDLSIGQWQKLALARAYLRDAAVLVLDEPTAALDARAEVEVYRQFRDAAQGRTTLLISHRLGSARLADRILVIDQGRITEEGRHEELIAQSGRYAELYTIQAAWYQ